MDSSTWLTPEAHQKLVDELEELTTTGRVEITARIAEAREHGDLKENADYDAAKNEQGFMEARIRKLKHLLDSAEVREVSADGSVQVGTVVTVVDADGTDMEFFVAPAENKVAGFILASPDSPLGAALLGATAGDKVSYEAPAGTFSYEVKSVRVFDG
ncbi:MAG: transcription elongation factor GreA [Acidimicrobiia bacterium]